MGTSSTPCPWLNVGENEVGPADGSRGNEGQIQTLDDPPALSDLVVYIDTFMESIGSSRSSDVCDDVVASV